MAKFTDDNDEPITDFTGWDNEDLTNKQVKRKKKAKRQGYVDKDLDGKSDVDTFNSEDFETQWAKDLIDTVPELKAVFEDAAGKGWLNPSSGEVGKLRLENEIRETTWYGSNSENAREMLALEVTQPGEFAELLETAKMKVIAQGDSLGYPISDANANNLARQSLIGNWMGDGRGQKLNDALMGMADANALPGEVGSLGSATGGTTGSMGEYVRKLRDAATMNGVKFSESYYNNLAREALTGKTTIEDSVSEIRNQAADLWPPYADKIRAGYNARDLASGYIQNMASILQLDPETISLDDPFIKGSITSFDDQGNPKPKSLWEQSNELRKDPRWANSNNGQNEIASVGTQVLQMFGITN